MGQRRMRKQDGGQEREREEEQRVSGICAGVVQASGLEDGRCGCKGVRLSGGRTDWVGQEWGGTMSKGVGNVGDGVVGTWGKERVVEDSLVDFVFVLEVHLVVDSCLVHRGWERLDSWLRYRGVGLH